MGTEVNNIENMSQEELMALEDTLEAEAATEQAENQPEAEGPTNEPDQPKEPENGPEGGDDDGKQTSAKTAADEGKDAGKGNEPEQNQDEDLTKHVSPPSKWAQQRREAKQLKAQLEEFKTKAAEADTLRQEVEVMKGQMDWLKTAVQSKGIELSNDPLEVFSDEKIEEVREEFGDELAEMFTATKAILAKQAAGGQAKQEDPKPDPAKEEPKAQQQEPEVDPKLLEAIDDNDELSYWREQSPALWSKAIEIDSKLLAEPRYQALSYEERFKEVVEAVKTAVTKGVSPKGESGQDTSPPESLSGSPGVAPTQEQTSALDRVLAAGSPEKQMEVYSSLPQHEKDQVDQALNI